MSKIMLATAFVLLAGVSAQAQAQAQTRDAPSPFMPLSRDAATRSLRADRPPEISYYIYYDQKEWGPFTLDQLKTMAGEEKFFSDDMVRKSGSTEWLMAGDYPELAFAPEYSEPVPAAAAEGAFFIDDAGQATGPFTLDEMKAKAEEGGLTPASIVWTQGMDGWTQASEVAALKPLLARETVQQEETQTEPDEEEAGEGTQAQEEEQQTPDDGQNVREEEPDDEGQAKVDDGIPPPPDAEAELPPPPPDEKVAKYYVSVDGKATGPYTEDQIKEKISKGEIAKSTYLWWKGAEWAQAEKVALFASAFDEAVKPPPFDCTGYLVGTWEKREMLQGHSFIVQLRFDANGQYQGVQGVAGYPGSNMYGSWTAEAVGEKTCSLTTSEKYPNTQNLTSLLEIVDRQAMTDKSNGVLLKRLW